MDRPVDRYRAIVQKYRGRLAWLSPEESAELNDAYQQISHVQATCFHRWEEVTMFTGTAKECAKCDLREPGKG